MYLLSLFNKAELVFMVYLVIVNIVSFIAFGVDKRRSKKNKWRTRESFLFLLSLLGGASGSLIGMLVFHHKIGKRRFYIGIPLVFILNRIVEMIIFAYI